MFYCFIIRHTKRPPILWTLVLATTKENASLKVSIIVFFQTHKESNSDEILHWCDLNLTYSKRYTP